MAKKNDRDQILIYVTSDLAMRRTLTHFFGFIKKRKIYPDWHEGKS